MKIDILQIIEQLHQFSPRLLANQRQAAEYIKSIFKDCSIDYLVEEFSTFTPNFSEYSLKVDGKNVECRPTSLVSGVIGRDCYIVDSQNDYADYDKPNINYNGKSDCISRSSHYPVPSLAISRRDVEKVRKAKIIEGMVKVEKIPHISQNIILGNLENPTNLVFTHFDSLEGGAMDNASGTAATIMTILAHPEFLNNNLFVLSSDEELSFEEPTYWGKGYREFQNNHTSLFDTASKIYIIDGLGLTKASVHKQEIEEFFPIIDIEKYVYKTFAVSCDILPQWSVYHSSEDTPEKLIPAYLEQSLSMIESLFK